jgi:hypothetical protein
MYVLKQDTGGLGACCPSCAGGGPCVTSTGLGEIGGFNSILLAVLGVGAVFVLMRSVAKKASAPAR